MDKQRVRKWLFGVMACLYLSGVQAAGVNLEFKAVGLAEFLHATYGQIFGLNYSIDPQLIKDERKVTLMLHGVEKDKLRPIVAKSLETMGIRLVEQDGVVHVLSGQGTQPVSVVREKPPAMSQNEAVEAKPGEPCDTCLVLKATGLNGEDRRLAVEEVEYKVYRPKYRSADMLQLIANNLLRVQRDNPQPHFAPLAQGQYQQGLHQSMPQQAQASQLKMDGAVLLVGGAEQVDKVGRLLTELDTSPGELFIKGAIYEINTTSKSGSGFSLALSLLEGRFGVGVVSSGITGNGVKIANSGAIGLEAIYSALASDNRFKSVSTPTLRVSSGQSATFSAGATVPVRAAATLDKNGNPVQSIEYKPSGVVLSIAPHIREQTIDMGIKQQLSSFTTTTTSGIDSPTMLKREIDTKVSVQPGEIIMLGGLEEEKGQQDVSGVPFLPDFLKTKNGEESKTEILVFLEARRI